MPLATKQPPQKTVIFTTLVFVTTTVFASPSFKREHDPKSTSVVSTETALNGSFRKNDANVFRGNSASALAATISSSNGGRSLETGGAPGASKDDAQSERYVSTCDRYMGAGRLCES